MTPAEAIALAQAAHRRLVATAAALGDDAARRPSRLPGWTVGHVLSHLARNAEGHVGRLAGALLGEAVPRYPGGPEQRAREIEGGAGRPASALAADVLATAERLEAVWTRSEAAGWPHAQLLATDSWPTTQSPIRRLREVEVHHVDLGLGYEPQDWPAPYVAWELQASLPGLPARLRGPADRRRLLAWVVGRGPSPTGIELDPWL